MVKNGQIKPRGFRNNNPLNIKLAKNDWVCEIKGDDPVFCTFSSMEYGVRAAFLLFRRYIGRGFYTPAKLISRWAPASENATNSYIRTVCARSSLSWDSPLNFNDSVQMVSLFNAMCFVENGAELDLDTVNTGYRLAAGGF